MRISFNKMMQRNAAPFGQLVAALVFISAISARADDDRDGRYRQTNLVSDQPGVALLQDPKLINAWGISFGPATPFWVSAADSGLSMVYGVANDSSGMVQVAKRSLEVTIPGGAPTGQVFNDTPAFNGNRFIFASEAGTISGWRPALGTAAETLAARATAGYKGLTKATIGNGLVLLAANFHEGTLDVYDANSQLVGQFTDPAAPVGYAPFNVQNIGGVVFVTFAKQDADQEDDVPGPGHGLIDIFNPETKAFHRLVTGTDAGGKFREINSPWGIAVAPSTFGEHADELLVGNFGSGTIMTFDERGRFRGLLRGVDNHPIVIDGLWGLAFGNGAGAGYPGTLYFSAGPDGESHGLFGSLDPVLKEKHNNRRDGRTH